MRGIIRIIVKPGRMGDIVYAGIVQKLREECLSSDMRFEPNFSERTVTITKEGSKEDVEKFMKRGMKEKAQYALLKKFMSVETEMVE
jgi:hypothetical protein